MIFYPGIHMIAAAHRFDRCMISVNVLRRRKSDFAAKNWIMDSGAFTEISRHGGYRTSVHDYAHQIMRWSSCGNLEAAVSQDWMCEPFILGITGKTVRDHQLLTTERYDELLSLVRETYVMPVLQGYRPQEYVEHIRLYGDRLTTNMWVGVGSVCKRNGSPESIATVLAAIRHERPDLRLHGFGVKQTSLANHWVRTWLHSSDSMAWSFAARRSGRDANDWKEAMRYCNRIENICSQRLEWDGPLFTSAELAENGATISGSYR